MKFAQRRQKNAVELEVKQGLDPVRSKIVGWQEAYVGKLNKEQKIGMPFLPTDPFSDDRHGCSFALRPFSKLKYRSYHTVIISTCLSNVKWQVENHSLISFSTADISLGPARP